MKKILTFILFAALMAVLLPLSLTARAAEVDPNAGMLDEIIIKFFDKSLFPGKEKQYDDEVGKILKDGLTVVTENVYVIKAENLSKNPNAIINSYKNSKFIEYVEPNYTGELDAIPNDPNYANLKALLAVMNAPAGWDIITGGGPIVAVVDSGVYQHPDLPQLLPGYSAVAGLSPNNDKLNHGTGVAGTIGARGNNGTGTVGINWNAKILPVKVDDANGAMTVATMAKGIMWAADNGAKVISLSISTTADSVTLKNAIDYAYNKGCAIFASSSNEGISALNYPSRYANVMAVGATANGTTRAAFSNYGTGMGVVAISSYTTTTASGGYAGMGGTSFSTPQVSGLASLMLAVNPNLSNDEVYSYIQQGAKPLGGGYNIETGYGLIDIQKTLALVQASAAPPPIDTTPPVLTLLGSQVMELRQGVAFTEPGYTAIDDTDGNITSRVTVTGSVNVNVPGVYRLEYRVADTAGNFSEAVRVVEVILVDDTPPVLTLLGGQVTQVNQGGSFAEPGYTATDNVDGDITNKVVVTGTVNTNVPGGYTLTYTVSDAAGNTSTATRTVEVISVDTTPPVLTLLGNQAMQISQGGTFADPGYTAIDNVDGDITNKVTVTGSVNANTPGSYTLTYTVSDAAGNTSTATRVVEVIAAPAAPVYTLPPVITLSGSTEMQIFTDDNYIEPGYSAVDCLGVNLTGAVRVTDNINVWTPGVYTVNYTVEDAGGKTVSAARTVIVTEREAPPRPAEAPTLTIIGSDPIILHIDSGTPYTEQGAYAYDEADGDISGSVNITGNVNRNSAGTYTITYKVVNSAGLEASARRDVRVLSPSEKALPRSTYNFSGQGKAVSTNTHKGIKADDDGWMDFSVKSLDKNMTIDVDVYDQSGNCVFSDTYTGAGGTQFWADEGTYSVDVTISAANGNSKYDIRLVTPEAIITTFDDDEVPLSDDPEDIRELISAGSTPLEICLKFGFPPERLNVHYPDFIAFGWSKEDLEWFGLNPAGATGIIEDGDVPLSVFPAPGIISYVVVKGDNLTKIALKFYGDGNRWYEIYEMNKAIIGANPSYLKIGTVLTIKAG